MIQTTTYNSFDLKRGKCKSCGLRTKVVIDNGRCPDCIEAQKFYEETMNGVSRDRFDSDYLDTNIKETPDDRKDR